jgi:small subunit ribosomal protein S15
LFFSAKKLAESEKSRTFAPAFDEAPSVMKAKMAFEGCLVLTINSSNDMYLDKEKKVEIFSQYGKSATDTGSAEAQIALFTYRIKHLTEHLKQNHKDHATARSLTMMVGRRRKLLKYLYVNDINRYRAIVKALGLRK